MTATGSPQTDRFTHERLPPADKWPVMLPVPGGPVPEQLNCVSFLLECHLETDAATRPAIYSGKRMWSYETLSGHVERIAALMAREFGVKPGNRVLIRGANSPETAAVWLAIQKIGAVAVTTMSLLRAGELNVIVEMSQPALAVCAGDLLEEMENAIAMSGGSVPVISYGPETGELYDLLAGDLEPVATCRTLAEDISLIAFTSGTTGRPKATVHFHRDVLAICRTICTQIIDPQPSDVFIGTAPLAFTFGLGGLLVFPFYAGAATVLNARYSPEQLLSAINSYRATVCFTVPTFFQQMLKLPGADAVSALRLAVSSGEALPLPVREHWLETAGYPLTEVLGSTEMLHAFIGAAGNRIRPGFIGTPLKGYEAAILDDDGNALPAGEIGRLAVRGPTGCRYLDDERQSNYVQNGWNLTGDACSMSEDGYVAYHTRYDDMIISAGYNISGLEVENALLEHPAVAECAVTGEADAERGQIVVAHVVPSNPVMGTEDLARQLQDHVKASIAPYKYPRRIRFMDALPRNESGKIQRFRLRDASGR